MVRSNFVLLMVLSCCAGTYTVRRTPVYAYLPVVARTAKIVSMTGEKAPLTDGRGHGVGHKNTDKRPTSNAPSPDVAGDTEAREKLMRFWLAKTEPGVYSYDDLLESGHCWWDGVRNYQARNNLASMLPGDLVVIYHSNAEPPGAVGVARVTQEAQPDPSQFDPRSPYYDAKVTLGNPRWVQVKMEPVGRYARTVPLQDLREHENMRHSPLTRKSNRLSVMELSEKEYATIGDLGGSIR